MNSLYKKLKDYCYKDVTPLHMPGGKRNSRFTDFPNPYSLDITEIEGFDNLHHATGILSDEMKRASYLYGSDESLICVNGSTSALTAAICGAFEKGDKVLVARNCHISVINAIIIRELIPLFLYPEKDGSGIYKKVDPDDVRKALKDDPDIKGFIMTSPTYEGVVSDTGKIAGIIHEYNKILIVDEAHGAHFVFHEIFPESAVRSGADAVVNSLHKTLPALTQTALLHLNGSVIDRERIIAFWNICQTTSPSYVLMGSISSCFDILGSAPGRELFKIHASELIRFRDSFSGLRNIKLFESEDPGKIVMLTNDGKKLYDHLVKKHEIQPEMYSFRYVVAMTSVADDKRFYQKLEKALSEEDVLCEDIILNYDVQKDTHHLQRMFPYEAFEHQFIFGKKVKADNAVGAVSLKNIIIYPPGIPLLVAGEVIDKEDVRIIKNALRNEFEVLGIDQISDDDSFFMIVG